MLVRLLVWGRTRDEYGISTAYFPNKRVVAFDDRGNTDRFQDEVYHRAQEFLKEKDLCNVLDVGCGSGFKLMKYFSDQETLGLELPHTLDFLKQKYPHRQWALSDFMQRRRHEILG